MKSSCSAKEFVGVEKHALKSAVVAPLLGHMVGFEKVQVDRRRIKLT